MFRTALLSAGVWLTVVSAYAVNPGDRIHIERGAIYQGNGGIIFRAIEQTGVCNPKVEPGILDQAFIRISNAGAGSICFSLDGFSADGKQWDPAYREQAIHILEETDYRWMSAVVRVLGELQDAPHEVRLKAVRAAGKGMRDRYDALYWIDGPRSEELARAFRKAAPQLAVASEAGGHAITISDPKDIVPGVPSVLVGGVPYRSQGIGHCILPDAPESYALFEKISRHRAEFKPGTSSDHGLNEAEKAEGFVSLFNGHNFDGWAITGWNKWGFVVEGGAIVWKVRGGDSVRTHKRYGDFILRLQFNIHNDNGNSGLFLRAPRTNRESSMGMEFQINGDFEQEPHKNGTGSIYDVVAPLANPVNPPGAWNDLEIRLEGPNINIILNGVVIQDISMDDFEKLKYRNREGFIALQDHNDAVSFRRIRIREL